MTTTDYWSIPAAVSPAAIAPRKEFGGVPNWRLLLALGVNVLAWAAIIKTVI